MVRNESDTAWKEILDSHFKDCLDYCLPQLSDLVDWTKPWIALDKELQAITKGTESGTRILDKLFRILLKDGREQWILIHVEVQGQSDPDFPKRMFTYGYRIYDKYQQPVVSCAILTDAQAGWCPRSYEVGLAGSYLRSEFLVIKLIGYQDKIEHLEKSTNPFASVILIQLKALESKSKPDAQRKQIKYALTRRLYERGFDKKSVINLYKFLDWLIGLPQHFELEYLKEVYELEESKKMAYISTAEKIGIEKGLQQGLQQGIEHAKLEVAKKLLDRKFALALVAETTGLSLQTLEELEETIN